MPLRWTPALLVTAVALLIAPLGGIVGEDAASGDCHRVEAFAARLTDVGYAYDYQPSTSPRELAGWAETTVHGTLTGRAELGGRRGVAGDVYLGYEVAVDEVLVGRLPGTGTTATVAVGYAPGHADLAATAAAVPAGVEVVVFGQRISGAPGGLVAAPMEGFVLGCDDGVLRGWVGDQGDWVGLRSAAEVVAAVTGQRP